MDAAEETGKRASLSDYLAAERTLLAWIRTALALMGFGFVVARFGLFLRELQFAQNVASVKSSGLSLWFGTAMIAAGVIVTISAGFHHARLVRDLDRGNATRSHQTVLAVVITIFLALVGVGMTIYLMSIRNSSNARENRSENASTVIPEAETGTIIIRMFSNDELEGSDRSKQE